jgi:hypothetical protein
MSEVRQMNKEIRWRAAVGAVVVAATAAVASSPGSWVDLLVDGRARNGLGWNVLIGPFLVGTFLLEALEVGRHPRHRARVNEQIARDVIRAVCSKPDCPQATEPNDSAREAAMAIFYREIDQPSREVAFYQWGWYYTSRLWLGLALLALTVALAVSFATSTDDAVIRWSAVAVLAGAALVSFAIAKLWEEKTLNQARMQVIQILPRVGTTLPGATCPERNCPAT